MQQSERVLTSFGVLKSVTLENEHLSTHCILRKPEKSMPDDNETDSTWDERSVSCEKDPSLYNTGVATIGAIDGTNPERMEKTNASRSNSPLDTKREPWCDANNSVQ